MRAGKSYSGVFPRRHKNGSILLVDMTATPIGTASGEMVGFIALCRAPTHPSQPTIETPTPGITLGRP